MSYTKQTWVNGDIITADKLNHIEDGIAEAGGGSTIEPLEITFTYDDDSGTITANKTYSDFNQEWFIALDDVPATVDLNKINIPCVITYITVSGGEQTTEIYNGFVARTPQAESNDGWGLALVTVIEGIVVFNSEEFEYEYHLIPNGIIFYQHEANDIINIFG